jgi:DNA-directed RNA polymerase specialized sigma24 family protein
VFGGLTVEETAKALDLSAITVKRDWRSARAWLKSELDRRGDAVARPGGGPPERPDGS